MVSELAHRRGFGQRVGVVFFVSVCATTCLASLLGLLWRDSVYTFYLDQPRVHYGVILLACIVVAASLKRWKLVVAMGLCVALNTMLVWPTFAGRSSRSDAPDIVVVHANLGMNRIVSSELLRIVRDQQPDLLCLQEVTPELAKQLPKLLSHYRLLVSEPRRDTRGVAVWAKRHSSSGFQIIDSQIIRLAPDVTDRPHVVVSVSQGTNSIEILSFHCSRPRNAATLAIQRAEYDALAAWFQARQSVHAIAIGDFNSSPWSRAVRRLLIKADLPARQSGFAFEATWPAGLIGLMGVPIDLVVHSAGLHVETESGPDIGSDHSPIISRVLMVPADDQKTFQRPRV